MYAIPFLPEVMEYRFISARIKFENNSKVVRSSRVGYAENVSLLIQVQIGVGVCAGHAAWETVQNCDLAQRSYFENGAVVLLQPENVVLTATRFCHPPYRLSNGCQSGAAGEVVDAGHRVFSFLRRRDERRAALGVFFEGQGQSPQ
jgi:hypothetical protein